MAPKKDDKKPNTVVIDAKKEANPPKVPAINLSKITTDNKEDKSPTHPIASLPAHGRSDLKSLPDT